MILGKLLGRGFGQFATLGAGIGRLDDRYCGFVELAYHLDTFGTDGLVDLVAREPREESVTDKDDNGKDQQFNPVCGRRADRMHSFFATLVIAKEERTYEGSIPLVTFGALMPCIIAVFTIASGAIILIPTWLWSLGLISHIDR